MSLSARICGFIEVGFDWCACVCLGLDRTLWTYVVVWVDLRWAGWRCSKAVD